MTGASSRGYFRVGVSNLALRILGSFSKFVLLVFLAAHLSAEALGRFSLLSIYVDYTRMLIGMTFYVHLVREMPKYPQEDWGRLFGQYLWYLTLSCAVILPMGIAFVRRQPELEGFSLLYGALVTMGVFNTGFENYLIGASRSITANLMVAVRSGVWVYVLVAAAWLKDVEFPLPRVLLSWLFAETAALGIGWFRCGHEKPQWLRPRSVDSGWIRAGLRVGWQHTLAGLSVLITTTSSRIVLSRVSGEAAVGVLSLYYGIASVVATLSYSAVIVPRLPRLLAMASAHNHPAFQAEARGVYRDVVGSSLFMLGAVALAVRILLPFLGGPSVEASDAVVGLSLLAGLAYAASQPAHYELYALGRDGMSLASSALGAGVSILVSILLIPRSGLLGAATALMIGNAALVVAKTGFAWRANGDVRENHRRGPSPGGHLGQI